MEVRGRVARSKNELGAHGDVPRQCLIVDDRRASLCVTCHGIAKDGSPNPNKVLKPHMKEDLTLDIENPKNHSPLQPFRPSGLVINPSSRREVSSMCCFNAPMPTHGLRLSLPTTSRNTLYA